MLTDKEREIAKMHYEAILRKEGDLEEHWQAIREMVRPDNAQELSDLRIIVILNCLPELLAQEGLELKKDYIALGPNGEVIASTASNSEKKYQA